MTTALKIQTALQKAFDCNKLSLTLIEEETMEVIECHKITVPSGVLSKSNFKKKIMSIIEILCWKLFGIKIYRYREIVRITKNLYNDKFDVKKIGINAYKLYLYNTDSLYEHAEEFNYGNWI